MDEKLTFFATTAKHLEPLLADELRTLGADSVKQTLGGVHFEGELATAYRACLWSRIANRILLPLSTFTATDGESLYDGAQSIQWNQHFDTDNTIAVDCVTTQSRLTHSHYCAQRVKDAVVDQFMRLKHKRPSVYTQQPDILINCFIKQDQAILSLDLSGDSLHRRGYRLEGARAPLKENLAAAILLRARWDRLAADGASLIDPMCGSGTFLIEAAMIAADIAPGLQRDRYGFMAWSQHDDWLWQNLLDDARQRRQKGLPRIPLIFGFDNDQQALDSARANVQRAGLEEYIIIDRADITHLTCPQHAQTGLIVMNPPYGERLGYGQHLPHLYQQIGETLRSEFLHWQAAAIVSDPSLGKAMGIRAKRIHKFFNGPLECQLLHFTIETERFMHQHRTGQPAEATKDDDDTLSPGAEMFANRLQKNLKQLGKWAAQNAIHCYRLYDADMPEYAVAIDIYQGEKIWLHVQEYAPPASIAEEKASRRLEDILTALPYVLEVEPDNIYLKTRQKQKGARQYIRHANRQQLFEVEENGLRFQVNFSDYLDTGLFLDHRPTREMIRHLAKDTHFLNLFAYTGAASVYAASGGARTTTSIDMSRTYLEWCKNNFKANHIPLENHHFIQEDCLVWLKQPARQQFDLIFLDPPTFSNSKRMKDNFDVQRDHEWLIQRTMQYLAPNGLLIFSNNFRKFKMSPAIKERFDVRDITVNTLAKDFQRNAKIHNCWKITHRQSPQ